MEQIKQYDEIVLTDGREGTVVEIYGEGEAAIFAVDVGRSMADWDCIEVPRRDIARVVSSLEE